jgi:cobalt-zinc-cadmium efflux system outer membrane protein
MKNKLLIIGLLIGVTLHAQNLDDYYKLAAENNPGLKSQYAQFEAAMQKVSQVNSLPDPTLSFGYFISPVETRVGPQQAKFSLTQMFPWFGTLSSQGNAATLMAEAKYQSFLDARNMLFYQVASAYYPLFEQKGSIKIVQENVDILEAYKTISNSKFKNGSGSLVDVLRVDILLKESQTDLEILKKKESSLLTTFNKLLNRDALQEVVIMDELAVEFIPEMYRKDSLLTDNPLLHSVDLKIKAQEMTEDVVIKQGLPKFGIGLDYVLVGERNDVNISDNGKDVLMPTVSITVPIFRGKYKAARKEAQLLQESYIYEKQEISNTLVSFYEMAFFEAQRQAELITLYNMQITESRQVLNLLFKDYGNSGKAFEEVLRVQQQLLKYDKLKISALAAHEMAIAKLDYITSKNK